MMKCIPMVFVVFLCAAVAQAGDPSALVARSQELMNEQSLAAQITLTDGKVLIRQVVVDGFLLKNDGRLAKINKACRNKRLTADEVKDVVAQVRSLYVEAGYEKMVTISYQIKKGRLAIFVALQS